VDGTGFGPRGHALRDKGGPVLAMISWVVIAVLAGTVFWGANKPEPPAPPPEKLEALPPPGPLEPIARVIVGAGSLQPKAQAAALLPMAKMFAGEDQAAALRVAILRAELEGPAKGIESIDAILKDAPEGSAVVEPARRLRGLLESGPATLPPDQAEVIRREHGWLGELAVTIGLDDKDPARAAIIARAQRSVGAMFVLEVVLFGGGGLAALVCAILGVVFLVTGSVRPSLAPPAPGGSVFLETFAAFLVAMALLHLAMPVFQAAMGQWAILAQWLVAPVAFYPLLRGVPAAQWRFAIGWHRGRGVLREMCAGVLGYLACAPVVLAGVGLTLLLMAVRAAMSGPVEQPSHPLGRMLGGATAGQVIALITLATVWAPVVEETVFRGALYHHLRGRLHWIVAGLIQAFIFAAIHPQGWMAIPALGSIGLSFSLLREWRTSLIAPMTAHALNNGTITLLLLVLFSV